ncbi:hypothetical protein P886_1268 [Alteromonadaceae bacterium 2753L.S.0a.02]|nr:hypothetical protein P886_1268 [Alteromonadaceae bacterium 2753L.S.0a.02]
MEIVFILIVVSQEIYAFIASRDLARELRTYSPEIYSGLGKPEMSYWSRKISIRLLIYVFSDAVNSNNPRVRSHSVYLRWVWLFRLLEIIALFVYLKLNAKT